MAKKAAVIDFNSLRPTVPSSEFVIRLFIIFDISSRLIIIIQQWLKKMASGEEGTIPQPTITQTEQGSSSAITITVPFIPSQPSQQSQPTIYHHDRQS